MTPKYGIIGCGYMSEYYFQTLKDLDAPVVHVVDIDVDRANQHAKQFNARVSSDYRELVADPDVTVVIVLAHTQFHKEMCLAAIEAGKNVICEKTLANDAEEAREIAQRARQAGVLFYVAFMKRFFPAVQKAQELLPELGIVYSAHARSYQYWGNLYETENFSDELWLTRYGGGILKCAGSHILDLIMFLLGRPSRLYARTDFVESSKLDRGVVALLEYPGCLTVSFEAAGHSLKRIGYERSGWDERMEINGTEGRLDLYTTTWNKSEEHAALLVHYDDRSESVREYRYDAVNTFQAQMESFHHSLTMGAQIAPSVNDGYNVDVLISAIMDSGKAGGPVDLDWTMLDRVAGDDAATRVDATLPTEPRKRRSVQQR